MLPAKVATFFRRYAFAVVVTAAIGVALPAQAQSIAVIVNGEPITNYDVDQRSKFLTLTTRKTPPRNEVVQELIDEKIKVKEGKKYGIEYGATEVDSAFANMSSRMRLTPDQLAKSLESQGIRPDTLKSRMRAELVWGNLVRGRFRQSLFVGEKESDSKIEVTSDKDKDANFEYQMRSVVLIAARADSGTLEQRRKEAEALRSRVQSCDDAVSLFRSMRGAAVKELIIKTSADLPPALREILDKTTVGRLTPPEVTKQGVEMVALCSRKPTTADTPQKREARDKLYLQKFEAKSKEYLAEVRKAAMIEYR
ncbi:MAG: SurA N- domain family protein [Proteobacteria bacterium SG_bin9]|nr:MAG: SurA N- domain family protein [Proteobacteria bacterium SG_bin9]